MSTSILQKQKRIKNWMKNTKIFKFWNCHLAKLIPETGNDRWNLSTYYRKPNTTNSKNKPKNQDWIKKNLYTFQICIVIKNAVILNILHNILNLCDTEFIKNYS